MLHTGGTGKDWEPPSHPVSDRNIQMPSTTTKEFWIVESGLSNPRVRIWNNVQPEIKRIDNNISTLGLDAKLM